MTETLSDVVDEYLHWRKVNPHIKGGENYLKRLRDASPEAGQPVDCREEFEVWWDSSDDIPNNWHPEARKDTPLQFAWAAWQAAWKSDSDERATDFKADLLATLYPNGIKHPQQCEEDFILHRVKELIDAPKRESGEDPWDLEVIAESSGEDPWKSPLLVAISLVGVYPKAFIGSDGDGYTERTERMNGWNDAVLTISRNYAAIKDALSKIEGDVK